jgi:hypothetical protein
VHRGHNCTDHAKKYRQEKVTIVLSALQIQKSKKKCDRAANGDSQQVQATQFDSGCHKQVREPLISDPWFSRKGVRKEIGVRNRMLVEYEISAHEVPAGRTVTEYEIWFQE